MANSNSAMAVSSPSGMDCGCSASLHMRTSPTYNGRSSVPGLVDERPTSIHCQSSAPLIDCSIPAADTTSREPLPAGPADYTALNPVLERRMSGLCV
jgi:hypothetical protein